MYDKMFEEKRKGYDKQEYMRYLKEQETDKKRRAEAEKYMNDQEYRLNMNQLNVSHRLDAENGEWRVWQSKLQGSLACEHRQSRRTFAEEGLAV